MSPITNNVQDYEVVTFIQIWSTYTKKVMPKQPIATLSFQILQRQQIAHNQCQEYLSICISPSQLVYINEYTSIRCDKSSDLPKLLCWGLELSMKKSYHNRICQHISELNPFNANAIDTGGSLISLQPLRGNGQPIQP